MRNRCFHFIVPLFAEATIVPVSGIVVTFVSAVTQHAASVDALRSIPEVEVGPAGGSKLALVVDSLSTERDQEIWAMVQQLPGVIDVALALVATE